MRDADLADIAMVTSLRLLLDALEANLFSLVDIQIYVLLLFDLWRSQQGKIEQKHCANHDAFNDIIVYFGECEQPIEDKNAAKSGENKSDRHSKASRLRFIL